MNPRTLGHVWVALQFALLSAFAVLCLIAGATVLARGVERRAVAGQYPAGVVDAVGQSPGKFQCPPRAPS